MIDLLIGQLIFCNNNWIYKALHQKNELINPGKKMAGHKIPCIKYGNNIIILFDGESD